jgi:hypothetical protein
MSKSLVTSSSNVQKHVENITLALNKAHEARFEVIRLIKLAYDDLGKNTFQQDLAEQLSISPPTLSKYLQIANCTPLIERVDRLPDTFTTLYDLTRLRSELIKAHGERNGEKRFSEYLDKHVDTTTESNQIVENIKKIVSVGRNKKKKEREDGLLEFSGGTITSDNVQGHIYHLEDLLKNKKTYRTILINPTNEHLKWMNDPSIYSSDIANKYKIADLRSPSVKETVQGFVYCPANYISAGLKILEASGFEYRDLFFVSIGTEGFEHQSKQKILLRGERGKSGSIRLEDYVQGDDEGATMIAESLGSEPRLYVFTDQQIGNWTCSNT